jgi:hypothetical protein
MTMRRLVTAYARGQDRSFAKAENVDAIMPIIERTLAYLLRQRPAHATNPPSSRSVVTQAWLSAQQGEASSHEWTERFVVQTGRAISERTMRRALVEAGARLAHDSYRLPPSADYSADTEPESGAVKRTNGHRRSRRLLRRRPPARARQQDIQSAGQRNVA